MPGKTFTDPGIVLRQIKEGSDSDTPTKFKYQLYYIDYTRLNGDGRLTTDEWIDPKVLMDRDFKNTNRGRPSISLGDQVQFKHDAANKIFMLRIANEKIENSHFVSDSHLYYETILVISDSQKPQVWTDMTGLYSDDSSSILSLPRAFFDGNPELEEAPWYIGICPKCPIKVILKARFRNLQWNQEVGKFDCDFRLELESPDSIQDFASFKMNNVFVKKEKYIEEDDDAKKDEFLLKTILPTLCDVPFIQEDMKRQNFRIRKPLKVECVRAIVTGKHTLLAPRNLTKNSVLRKSKFPIRITKRNVKGTHFLFPGDWVVCDLYLSPATPAWFAIIRYSIKEFKEYEESFENREFIDECTSIIGELDENLNMYYIEATDVRPTSTPGFYYQNTLGLIYDRCYAFTKLESAWCIDVSERCSIARLETIDPPLLEIPLPLVEERCIKNSFGLVVEHRDGNTVLFNSITSEYEIRIPNEQPELQIGTFVVFDAVFFEEHVKNKIWRYYRVTYVRSLPNFPSIEVRRMSSPELFHPTIEFKVRIHRELICEGCQVWFNSFLGPIEDPDCMLSLEPLEENSDIEISNFNLKATAKKDYFKTLGGVRINLQYSEKNTFEPKKDPQHQKKLKQKKTKKERAENEMKKNYQWAFVTKDDCLISYQALFRVSDTCHVKYEKEDILLSKKEKKGVLKVGTVPTQDFEKEYRLPSWFKYDQKSVENPLKSDEVNWEDFKFITQ
uniref:Uncharacterized protein n=1 Tax=Acrobeloides nanus TaxID=290746 RepID=A0A914CRY0_9BILA